MIFLALPFLFVAFVWQFPAGLLVYWITTNLWTIAAAVDHQEAPGPLREEAAAAAKAPRSRWSSRAKGKGKKRQVG